MAMRRPARPVLVDDDVGEQGRAAREGGGVVAGDGEARRRDVGEGAVRAGPVFPVGGEVGDRAVAPFGLHEPRLGTPAASPLDEQRANEQTLAEEHADDTGDLPLVIGPEVRLTIEHRAALRQPFLVNAPTPQLPPVEHQRARLHGDRPDRLGPLAPEQASRESGRSLGLGAVADEITANDSPAEPDLGGPERRRVRSPGDKTHDIGGDHRAPKNVGAVAGEEHHAAFRQLRQALQLLVEGQPDKQKNLDPRGPGLYESRELRRVRSVGRRRAADDDHQLGAWHEFKCDVDRAFAAAGGQRGRDVCERLETLERRTADVEAHHRYTGEQRLAIRQQKGERLVPLHRHKVEPPSGVLLSEKVRQLRSPLDARCFREVQVLDVEVDRRAQPVLERPAESGFHLGYGRCRIPNREEHQHRAGSLEVLPE